MKHRASSLTVGSRSLCTMAFRLGVYSTSFTDGVLEQVLSRWRVMDDIELCESREDGR